MMKSNGFVIRLMRVLFTTVLFMSGIARAGYSIYVDANGDDQLDGSTPHKTGTTGPVRSLERARDLVRALRQGHIDLADPVTVQLAAGIYQLTGPILLTAEDSGTNNSPTIYQGNGAVEVNGGIDLTADGWKDPDTACAICRKHPEIRMYTLPKAALLASGKLAENAPVPRSDLFFNGKRMPLARWPNNGFTTISAPPAASNSSFQFNTVDMPTDLDRETELWVGGYWQWDWYFISEAVASLAADKGLVQLKSEVKPYGIKQGARFFISNALAALDSPGEWYLNQHTGNLYFWPPSRLTANSRLNWPVVQTLVHSDQTSHIEFHNMTFSCARGTMIDLNHAEFVRLRGLHILDGNIGLTLEGQRSGITDSQIEQMNASGIIMTGGDRQTLTSSNLYIEKSSVHDFAQSHASYQAGISIAGVGLTVRENIVRDAPHVGILVSGNDNLLERNIVTHVVTETTDSGAIYIDRDWTARGNIIRYNYLYNIGLPGQNIKGVYLDDETSGTEVVGNVFWNVEQPVFINGGSDNNILQNYFINASPAITLDATGMADNVHAELQNPNSDLRKRLAAVPYSTSSIWVKKYPLLANLTNDGFGIPRRNRFQGNFFVGSIPYKIPRLPNQVTPNQILETPPRAFPASASSNGTAPEFDGMCKYLASLDAAAAICTK